MKYSFILSTNIREDRHEEDGVSWVTYVKDPDGNTIGYRVVEIEADTYEEACQKAKEMG